MILLSIIGIILAVVLALLFLVLLVPFRYQVHGRKKEDVFAKGYISWLLHFIHISFLYEKENLRGVVRVLGIPVKKFKSPKEVVDQTEEAAIKSAAEETKKEKTETAEVVAMEQSSTMSDTKEEEKEAQTEDKKTKSSKKKQKTEKTTVEDKKKKLTEIIELIKQFWQENKMAVQFLLKKVGELLKSLLPKKLKGTIWFGTGDPCSTGELTGALAVLYGIYGNNLQLYPDFNEQIFKGEIFMAGKIRLFTILRICITVVLDKNVKRLKNDIKRLKEDL